MKGGITVGGQGAGLVLSAYTADTVFITVLTGGGNGRFRDLSAGFAGVLRYAIRSAGGLLCDLLRKLGAGMMLFSSCGNRADGQHQREDQQSGSKLF